MKKEPLLRGVDRLDIDHVAFIGRTYGEYMRMFDLNESLLKAGPVLDCPAGPSSFTGEADCLGINSTACDILYDFPLINLIERGEKDIRYVFDKFAEVPHLYSWKYYKNKNQVISLRKRALELFSNDFSPGIAKGRYVQAELPSLPFTDSKFSLVLSSHFLFLYGDRFSVDFHKACLKELMRVSSKEVRIFPLSGLDAKPYPYMNDIISFLTSEDIKLEIVEVPFEFQRGSGHMMKLNWIGSRLPKHDT
jgi:hypothetical protein